MIDLHSHVLPAIDDGPPDLAGSLAVARGASRAGTTQLLATPHVNHHMPTAAGTMHDAVVALQAEIDAHRIPLRLRTGGELAITMAAELPEDELLSLRLGGGEWLLAECPLSASGAGFEHVLLHLQDRGHRIVLAHPERSPAMQFNPQTLVRLVEAGMITSITAGSLTGAFGPAVRRFTYDLLEEGLVHNVASDAHDAWRRPPVLMDAIEEAEHDLPGLMDLAEWLCFEVPSAVIDGGPVPLPPAPPPQRRRRLFRRH